MLGLSTAGRTDVGATSPLRRSAVGAIALDLSSEVGYVVAPAPEPIMPLPFIHVRHAPHFSSRCHGGTDSPTNAL